jgi:succinate-semialdehyde dehydrogenase / glutarate-semialdehyde dehydrogenase
MTPLSDQSLLKSCCYMAGRWYPEGSREILTVRNPATGEQIAEIPVCGAAETREAIAAAQQAFPSWRALTAAERGRRLRRWFELMLEHREDLALLMTAEQGKPLAEARGEIGYAASFLEWFAEEGKRTYGDLIPSPIRTGASWS